jgi:hypothetical protein
MRGAWAVQVLFTTAAAFPVIQLQNSAGTLSQDFYGNNTGTFLSTAANGAGSTVAAWMTANSIATAFVSRWYDQSYYARGSTGTQYNATTSTTGQRPTLNLTTNPYSVDGTGNVSACFNLPSGTVVGNSTYTFSAKFDYGGSSVGGVIGGGSVNGTSQTNNLRWNGNTGFQNYWFNNDYNFSNSSALSTPTVVTLINYNNGNAPTTSAGTTFTGGTTSTVYTSTTFMNGVAPTTNPTLTTRTSWNFQSGSDVLMKTTASDTLQSRMYWCINSSQAICQNDQVIIEAQNSGGGGGSTDPSFANVILLLHGEGANNSTTFVDSSRATNTMVIGTGSPVISTSQTKFGTASISLPAAAIRTSAVSYSFGTNPFTIEFWVYCSSTVATQQAIFANAPVGSSWGANSFGIYVSASKFQFWANNFNTGAALITGTTTLVVNTWYHYALVRSGSTFTQYVNGVSDGTYTNAATIDNGTSRPLHLGWDGATWLFTGFLDEVRITTGVARYTAAFTPPTAAFPDVGVEDEYPPSAMTTSPQTISGITYTATASDTFNTDYAPWKAFNKAAAVVFDRWNATGGGGPYTTPGFSNGSWLQLQLSASVTVLSYSLVQAEAGVAVTSWIIVASNNGMNWTQLDTRTVTTGWGTTTPVLFPISNSVSYTYYRLIVTGGIATIYEWRLFGVPYVISSLVAYYDFNETSSYSGSGTAVIDISGNNRNLTFSATPTFNASPQYIELTNTTTAGTASALSIAYQTTGLSIEALVWRDPNAAGFSSYFQLDTGSVTNSFRHNLFGSPTSIYYFGNDGGQLLYTNVAPDVFINNSLWYHVVYTFTEWSSANTTTGRCYINGTQCGADQVVSNASSNNFASTTVNRFIRLGKVSNLSGFTGRFAMGRIYNKPLTETEVKMNYASVYNTNNNQYRLPVVNIPYPFYSNIILLLHGNGPNLGGANSNGVNNPTVILDSSTSNNTMSVTQAVTTNAVSKYNGSSMLFNGASVINTSTAITAIGTGAFTVEFWFYASATSNYGLVSNYSAATAPTASWNISIITNKVVFRIGTTAVVTGTATIAATTWYHYALSRTAGGSVTQYVNGLADGSGTSTAAVDSANATIFVGRVGSASFFNGYIAELAITRTVAIYTAPFTPQVEPYGIREYPPIALNIGTGGVTSVSTTVSTTTYARGTYIATCSTTAGGFNPSMAFDKQSVENGNMWTTSTASYNTTTGNYIGTTYTTSGIAGEWLQLQLPTAIVLKRSVFVGRMVGNSPVQNPRIFYVFGSTNGSTWTQIDIRTGITSWGTGAPSGFNRVTSDTMSNNTAFSYYRLVINAVQASNSNGFAGIQEWRLFGDSS